jgi:hypothetical protein
MDMWMIVALLGLVIVLYASMLPRTPERKPVPDDFLDSVGDTLQQFADEIESENKELVRIVGEMKREHEHRTGKLLARIEQLEKHSAEAKEPPPSAAPAFAPVVPPFVAVRSEAETVIIPELPIREGPSARQAVALRKRVAEAEAAALEAAKTEAGTEVDIATVESPVPADEPKPEPPSRFANTVKSRYKEVFDLHDSGKSIEYIAKKLGKNKGEVQLILGLAKQEEPLHGQP